MATQRYGLSKREPFECHTMGNAFGFVGSIMAPSSSIIAPARFPADLELVRALFAEYIDGLGIDLSFQRVDAELSDLPGKYASPAGIILIGRSDTDDHSLGCVALRPLATPWTCEMKRLYVRPQARGLHLGYRLAEAIVSHARKAGYKRMVLDTLSTMHSAQNLYLSLGFRPTERYYDNPVPGTIYMALDL